MKRGCKPISSRHASTAARQRGFSLLEVLVAFAIMAIALGMIYNITGNNARQTGDLAGQERAMMLAQSLLAANELVPPEGVNASGIAQGFAWQVRSAPYVTPANNDPRAARLQQLQVAVQWSDGTRERQFALTSLRPERLPAISGNGTP